MQIFSFGDNIKCGEYAIHSSFDHVINFISPSQRDMAFLVDEAIGSGPLNIVVTHASLQKILTLKVTPKFIITNLVKVPKISSLIYNSSLEFSDVNTKKIENNILIFRKILLELAHPLSLAFLFDRSRLKNFKPGFEKAFADSIIEGCTTLNKDIVAGINKIKGRGFGLTPSGDDFIAGFFIGLNFLNKIHVNKKINKINDLKLAKVLSSENILSNTFIRLAEKGAVNERTKFFLNSLVTGSKDEVFETTKKMLEMGGSSGADLATGIFAALIETR